MTVISEIYSTILTTFKKKIYCRTVPLMETNELHQDLLKDIILTCQVTPS